MAKLQRFINVCDGGHIHGLNNLTADRLVKALDHNRRAILVVGNGQHAALRLLRSLNHRNKTVRGLRGAYNYHVGRYIYPLLRAKKIARWSGTATVWMVRQDGRKFN